MGGGWGADWQGLAAGDDGEEEEPSGFHAYIASMNVGMYIACVANA